MFILIWLIEFWFYNVDLLVTSTGDNQAVEEPQASRFTWTIENFSRQTNKKIYSDVFVVGGYKW